MLRILSALAPEYGYTVIAAHFDHRLRGEESDRDREFVRDLCADCGVELRIGYGDTREYALTENMGIEEAARELRYAFFFEILDDICSKTGIENRPVIATAHNADDNAETMLLNLTRGAGLRGLAGIPPVRGDIVRPLLAVTRTELEDYLTADGIPHVEDSSNNDTALARNRVRHIVMPVLKAINPRFLEHTVSAARTLREDDAYLKKTALDFISQNDTEDGIPVRDLYSLPRPVAVRVIGEYSGVRLSRDHFADVLDLCRTTAGRASLDLPGTLAFRDKDKIRFLPPRPKRR